MQKYTIGNCSGGENAALAGMGVLSSYLVLFIICECLYLLEELRVDAETQ
jgi:hypothetical protein